MSTGSTIKELRIKRQLTQKQLGKRVGIATAQISNYEMGKMTPRVDTFEKILNAMGYTLWAKPISKKEADK